MTPKALETFQRLKLRDDYLFFPLQTCVYFSKDRNPGAFPKGIFSLGRLSFVFYPQEGKFYISSQMHIWKGGRSSLQYRMCKDDTVRVQNKSPQNVPLWYSNHFELKATETL